MMARLAMLLEIVEFIYSGDDLDLMLAWKQRKPVDLVRQMMYVRDTHPYRVEIQVNGSGIISFAEQIFGTYDFNESRTNFKLDSSHFLKSMLIN